MQNAGLDEAQAGIKTAGRIINNLRYADNSTFRAESKEELNSHLMKVTEDEMVEWHHRLKEQEFEQFKKIVKDREVWCAIVHGPQRV